MIIIKNMVISHKFEKGNIVQKNNGEGPKMTVTFSTASYFIPNRINVMCDYFDEESKATKTLEFNQHELMLISKT